MRAIRLICWCTCGLALGAAAGVGAVAAAGSIAGPSPPDRDAARIIDVGHLPPLLRAPGDATTLRFNVFCPGAVEGEPCDAAGDVFIRAGTAGAFRKIPLRRTDDVADGRYVVDVPADLTASPGLLVLRRAAKRGHGRLAHRSVGGRGCAAAEPAA